MNITEATALIVKGINPDASQTWLDLGAGNGVFTRAIAGILKQPSRIVAVDLVDSPALRTLTYPEHLIEFILADFTDTTRLPSQVDGILIANALHFVADKASLLVALAGLLKSSGRLIVIEYDLERSNPWVPYPITQSRLASLVVSCGFGNPMFIGERQSTLNNSTIYSLACEKQ